jgi:hypothetical protein
MENYEPDDLFKLWQFQDQVNSTLQRIVQSLIADENDLSVK